ncbi:hypothetical protein F5883DRAFT_526302 [Diaporthe sp. PMI_573]|nr:hypothetical protein F5883DRAFT_526302 [Diaporthaceae sp. PMI_573]
MLKRGVFGQGLPALVDGDHVKILDKNTDIQRWENNRVGCKSHMEREEEKKKKKLAQMKRQRDEQQQQQLQTPETIPKPDNFGFNAVENLGMHGIAPTSTVQQPIGDKNTSEQTKMEM